MEQSTHERVDFESTRYNNYLLSLLATAIIILDGYQCQSGLVHFFKKYRVEYTEKVDF